MGGKELQPKTPDTSVEMEIEKDRMWRNMAFAISVAGVVNPGTDPFGAARFHALVSSENNCNSNNREGGEK